MLRFIDLFAGVGGFRYGFEQAFNNQCSKGVQQGEAVKDSSNSKQKQLADKPLCGYSKKLESVDRDKDREGQKDPQKNDEKRKGLESKKRKKTSTKKRRHSQHSDSGSEQGKFTCVYSNEWDKYANSVYRYHYGECDQRDITTVSVKEIPNHDLLCGGFPCQAFSVAGKRRGFEEARGTLFFDIIRIARDKRPKYLLLENVKGLLSHKQGETFQTMLRLLSDIGYESQWQVLNSKNFGVPQNRERVFIVGHLRGQSRPKVFPITQSSKSHLKYSGGVISAREKWLKDGKNNSRNFSQGQRIYSMKGISQTLAGNAGGQGGKTGLYEVTGALDANYYKGDNRPSNKSNRPRVFDKGSIRRLTPVECERLQGFPDDWTQYGVNGIISDTQRYKMMGNAVTTNVVTAITNKLV